MLRIIFLFSILCMLILLQIQSANTNLVLAQEYAETSGKVITIIEKTRSDYGIGGGGLSPFAVDHSGGITSSWYSVDSTGATDSIGGVPVIETSGYTTTVVNESCSRLPTWQEVNSCQELCLAGGVATALYCSTTVMAPPVTAGCLAGSALAGGLCSIACDDPMSITCDQHDQNLCKLNSISQM